MTKEEREVTRQELVARAKAILAEAYEEAAEMVVLYLERNPREQRQTLCKEIDPENWQALDSRVRRAQTRKASNRAEAVPSDRITDRGMGSYGRHTRQVLRDAKPEELREIMRDLPTERRAEVVRAAVPPPERASGARTGPTFIDLIVRVSSALIELEALVASWQNPSAIPAEFSQDSFNDIVAKVERIRRHFDQVEETRDDDDEFQKIVRNFRLVATDVG